MDLPNIAVFPLDEYSRRERMLGALAALYDLSFVPVDESSLASYRYVWLPGSSREFAKRVATGGTKVLVFCDGEEAPMPDPLARVELAASNHLPASFRGCKLEDVSLTDSSRLEVEPGEDVLARKGKSLLWVRNLESKSAIDLVSMSLPELGPDEHLFDHFHHGNWAHLLPALHFLAEVSPWTPPPLRACFMFDDPNLHWKTYGHVDYRALAEQGMKHNYHSSFAMVPFDGWYVNREACSIFKENKESLSFLIHGNNHTACELTSTEGQENRRKLTAQATQRIQDMEERSGLRIPRVMAAPHGACNPEMAGSMMRGGFDAACISRASIIGRNPGLTWPVTIGLEVSEFMGGGLPIIPRFNIRLNRGSEFSVRLAAFLGHPIIPVGHHDDLRKGLGLLSKLAALINSMGEVQWVDLNAIAETNFCTQVDADSKLQSIKLFSRRVRFKIPEGVTRLRVIRPWLDREAMEPLELRVRETVENVNQGRDTMIEVPSGQVIEIASIHPESFDPFDQTVHRTPPRALLRRILCEIRDRLFPIKEYLRPSN